jgi:hypothetical protein
MSLPFLGMLLGMLVGAFAAGPLGGAIGLVLGGVAGALVFTGRDAVQPLRGRDAVPEVLRLVCTPKRSRATATLLRDGLDGQWLDVASCSLCPDGVRCEKRCLDLLRAAVPPRRHRIEGASSRPSMP